MCLNKTSSKKASQNIFVLTGYSHRLTFFVVPLCFWVILSHNWHSDLQIQAVGPPLHGLHLQSHRALCFASTEGCWGSGFFPALSHSATAQAASGSLQASVRDVLRCESFVWELMVPAAHWAQRHNKLNAPSTCTHLQWVLWQPENPPTECPRLFLVFCPLAHRSVPPAPVFATGSFESGGWWALWVSPMV